jgi:hypothetical protein
MLNKLENIYSRYPFALFIGEEVELYVSEVIGDTLLSSVAWIFGSEKGGFDFYDTCIMLLTAKGKGVAIPASRVLSVVSLKVSKD